MNDKKSKSFKDLCITCSNYSSIAPTGCILSDRESANCRLTRGRYAYEEKSVDIGLNDKPTIEFSCDDCIHRDVCKYEEDTMNFILNDMDRIIIPLERVIKCVYYIRTEDKC